MSRRRLTRWKVDNPIETEELAWTVPGAVWAADFPDVPHRIDGAFDYLLATRDLAGATCLNGNAATWKDIQPDDHVAVEYAPGAD